MLEGETLFFRHTWNATPDVPSLLRFTPAIDSEPRPLASGIPQVLSFALDGERLVFASLPASTSRKGHSAGSTRLGTPR